MEVHIFKDVLLCYLTDLTDFTTSGTAIYTHWTRKSSAIISPFMGVLALMIDRSSYLFTGTPLLYSNKHLESGNLSTIICTVYPLTFLSPSASSVAYLDTKNKLSYFSKPTANSRHLY